MLNFTNDHRFILVKANAADDSYELAVVEAQTGKERFRFRSPTVRVLPAGRREQGRFENWVSLDNRVLALAAEVSSASEISFWSLEDGKQLSHLPNAKWLQALAPDGRTALVWVGGTAPGSSKEVMPGKTPGDLLLWDVTAGKKIGRLAVKKPVVESRYSPDSQRIGWLEDRALHLLNAADGKEVATLPVRIEGSSHWLFTPDGKLVVTVDAGGAVQTWDAATGKEAATLFLQAGAGTAFVLSPDGRLLGSTDSAGGWKCCTLADGKEICAGKFEGSASYPHLQFTPDSRLLLISGGREGVFLRDTATGAERGTLPAGGRLVGGGKYLLTQGGRLWDVATCRECEVRHGPPTPFTDLAYSASGNTLLARLADPESERSNLHVFDVGSGKERGRLLAPEGAGYAYLPPISPEGKYWLDGKHGRSEEGEVRVRETATGKVVATLPNAPPLDQLAFTADGSLLFGPVRPPTHDGKWWYAGRGKGDARPLTFWETATGKVRLTRPVPSAVVLSTFSFTLLDAGRTLLLPTDKGADLVDLGTGGVRASLAIENHSVAVGPDGRFFTAWKVRQGAAFQTPVSLWEAATGKELATLLPGEQVPTIFPGGRTLLRYIGDHLRDVTSGTVSTVFWDVPGNKAYPIPPPNLRPPRLSDVKAAAMAPDGKSVLLPTRDGKALHRWDLQAGKTIATFAAAVREPFFSPDGKQVWATEISTGALRVWDADTGKELYSLGNALSQVHFLAGGRTAAVSQWVGNTTRLVLVEAATGRILRTFAGQAQPRGSMHQELALAPDGSAIASLEDGAVKLFDTATGQERIAHRGPPSRVPVRAVTPDGRRFDPPGKDTWFSVAPDERSLLLSRAPELSLSLWDARTGKLVRRVASLPGQPSDGMQPRHPGGGLWLSPDGRWAAVLVKPESGMPAFRPVPRARPETLCVWDLATGEERLRIEDPELPFVFSRDSNRLAVGGKPLRVFDLRTGKVTHSLNLEGVLTLAFAPDGSKLAVGGADVRMVDLTTGASSVVYTPPEVPDRVPSLPNLGPAPGVYRVAFPLDGDLLLMLMGLKPRNRTLVVLYDLRDRRERYRREYDMQALINPTYALSPDGRTLALRTFVSQELGSSRLVFLDVASGQQRLALDTPTPIGNEYPGLGTISPLTFTPDGSRLLAPQQHPAGLVVYEAVRPQPNPLLRVPATGFWRVEGKDLVQDLLLADQRAFGLKTGTERPQSARLLLGDPSWVDYDAEAQVQWTAGAGQLGLMVRATNQEKRLGAENVVEKALIVSLGGKGAPPQGVLELTPFQIPGNLIPGYDPTDPDVLVPFRPVTLEKGRWYTVRVRVRGSNGEVWLDGRSLGTSEAGAQPKGGIGLVTWETAGRFRGLRVTGPGGEEMVAGVPELPAPTPAQEASRLAERGIALRRQGKREEALAALQDAVRLDPTVSVRPRLSLAELLYEAGRKQDAKALLEPLRLNPFVGKQATALLNKMAAESPPRPSP